MSGGRRWSSCAVVAAIALLGVCTSDTEDPFADLPTPTGDPSSVPSTEAPTTPSSAVASDPPAVDGTVRIDIDTNARLGEISPSVNGISEGLTPDEMRDAGVVFNSWGGNPSTRFNFQLGNAWNNGRDFEYRNTDYGFSGDRFRDVAAATAAADGVMRMAVPTLGWVARDTDIDNCSFPDDDGGCTGAGDAHCEDQGPIADPRTTSVESTPDMVAEWVAGLLADGYPIRYIAMDNEPELWGSTHYDVHPECPTYEELAEHYLRYAEAVREVAPDVLLGGPVICCWYDYWHVDPGSADGTSHDFVSWFLSTVREHDDTAGHRTLDVLDVHFYPQGDVFNEDVDPETSARRLRATRALWDPEYVDESWIGERIGFIPRMHEAVEQNYPDTPLVISEWNFGADTSMNGALAIADVLGIYGREGVEAAAYWRSPPPGSPGFLAFKLHGNYDGRGSRFGGTALAVDVPDPDALAAFAALDANQQTLKVMLINKDPDRTAEVDLTVDGAPVDGEIPAYLYSAADLEQIVPITISRAPISIPPYAVMVLEVARG